MSAETELFWLKFFHTLVFAGSLICLGLCAWFAVTGQGQTLALLAMILPVTVFVTQLFNDMECVIQTRARKLAGTPDEWVRDVFFVPRICALWIVRALFVPYVLAIGGSLIRIAFF